MSIHHLKPTATRPYERASLWISVKGHITEEQFREGHRLCGDRNEFPGGRFKSWATEFGFQPEPGVDPRRVLVYFREQGLAHEYETVYRWTGVENGVLQLDFDYDAVAALREALDAATSQDASS